MKSRSKKISALPSRSAKAKGVAKPAAKSPPKPVAKSSKPKSKSPGNAAAASDPSTEPAADSFCGGQLPPPAPQHEWLQRFAGEWDVEVEARMSPDQPPFVSRGIERLRSIGGYWVIGEAESTTTPYRNLVALGFDPQRGKYVGTWLDSMSSHLWLYEGTVNAAGDTLTLETEGPAPFAPNQRVRYREVTAFRSNDERVFTSSRLEANGTWLTHVTIHSRRRK